MESLRHRELTLASANHEHIKSRMVAYVNKTWEKRKDLDDAKALKHVDEATLKKMGVELAKRRQLHQNNFSRDAQWKSLQRQIAALRNDIKSIQKELQQRSYQ